MKAPLISLFIVLSFISTSLFAGEKAGARLPNIIFIFVDDMGVGDVGRYHDYFIDQGLISNTHFNYSGTTPETVIPTPNMDRICEEGMISQMLNYQHRSVPLIVSVCSPEITPFVPENSAHGVTLKVQGSTMKVVAVGLTQNP